MIETNTTRQGSPENELPPRGASSPLACSPADALRAEAERLGGVVANRNHSNDAHDLLREMRWAYSLAAAFLEKENGGAVEPQEQS